jgi:hypothetical protein
MNPEMFDAVEIHRCVECMDAGMNPYVEPVEEGEELPGEAEGAPFWSVYLHHAPGRSEGTGLECVADCATQEHAQLVANGLRQWIRTTA